MIERLEVRKIWSKAAYNSFTDLIRFRGRWFCAFREGTGHLTPDGALRILTSVDGLTWNSVASIPCPAPFQDLRDPQFSITPDGLLLLNAAAFRPVCQSMAWLSKDGCDWGHHHLIGPRGSWLWRTVWHSGVAYSFGRHEPKDHELQLYTSTDGLDFQAHGKPRLGAGYSNESDLLFLDDATGVSLTRCDGGNALLGTASSPYDRWTWTDLGVRIGGPALLRLPDGRTIAAVRLYDPRQRTALCWLDVETAALTEFLTLPSGGDTSYAGLVWHDDLLWLSYYSSDDYLASMKGAIQAHLKTSVYLAKVRLQPAYEAGGAMTRLKDLKKRLMEDAEFREEYARADDEFKLIEALVRARVAAKLTQTELAERLGTTQSAVARLEGGRVSPSLATLRRYAAATGTRLTVSLERAVPGRSG